MVRFIENIVITIDVFLLLGSEIYLLWLTEKKSSHNVRSIKVKRAMRVYLHNGKTDIQSAFA